MNRNYVLEVIEQIVKDKPTAKMVLERLEEEGVIHVGYGNAEVDQILEQFSNTFGTTKASRHDRFSANRLARKYGVQSIIGIVGLLGQNSEEKFAPVVNSVSELEGKMPSVLRFLRQLDKELDI